MKDSDRVERTVFLDKYMVQKILTMFLMTIFMPENKDFKERLFKTAQGRGLKVKGLGDETETAVFMLLTYAVDSLYKLYCKMEETDEQDTGETDDDEA